MKVYFKKAFKSFFFVTKKIIKTQTVQYLQYKYAEVSIFPISKSALPFSQRSFLFKEYLNPQIRINKMVYRHAVDYHSSLSELTSRMHLLIFLQIHKGFISPEYFLNFFLQLVYSPMAAEQFQIHGFQDYWKIHL